MSSREGIIWVLIIVIIAFNVLLFGKLGQIKDDLKDCRGIVEDPKRTENFATEEDIERVMREVGARIDNISQEIGEVEERLQHSAPLQVSINEIESTLHNATQSLDSRIRGIEEKIDNIYGSINNLRNDIIQLR